MRSENVEGASPRLLTTRQVLNNEGRVSLRSVLYLSYLKQDQMINRIVKTTPSFFIYLAIVDGARALFTLPERYSPSLSVIPPLVNNAIFYSRFSSLSQSVYAKADNISIETKCWGARLLQTNSPGNRFESEKIAAGSNLLHYRRVRSVVLKCFDIFLHLRGSGIVDKIKKYRRDSPSGVLNPSKIPLGIPYYNPYLFILLVTF